MRVLVIGSDRFEKKESYSSDIFKAAYEIGVELSSQGHTILICSVWDNTVDYHVLQGVLKDSKKSQIEIHIADNNDLEFRNEVETVAPDIPLTRHSSPDIQVVHMEVMRNADALIILGGSTRSERTGIAAHMLDKTVIPIGSFGGAGMKVWAYASGRRDEFYKQALEDNEIDKLAESWKGSDSAEFAVNALELVRKAEVKDTIPRFAVSGTFTIMLLAMLFWVCFITYGFNLSLENGLFNGRKIAPIGLIFLTVCLGGIVGASLKNLFDIRNGRRISLKEIGLDIALGLGAGFVSAILYLVLQVAVTGKANSIENEGDYVRITLLVSIVAIFAAMYLDAAFANFEVAKGSILPSEKEKRNKN